MKPVEQFPCVTCFLILLFIMQTDGQHPHCSDFHSPMLITANSVKESLIRFPKQTFQYKSNQRCEWTISTNLEGYCIHLHVIKCNLEGRDFDRECNGDYVDIFDYKDGNPVFINRFCDSDEGQTYQSASSNMTIRFHSNALFRYGGFMAVYKPVYVGPEKKVKSGNMFVVVGAVPAGLICLLVLIIIVKFNSRHFRPLRNAASSPPPPAYTQNTHPPHTFPRARSASSTANTAGQSNLQHTDRTSLFSWNRPVETRVSRSMNEGYIREQSVSPPPAYDSLDIGTGQGHHNDESDPPPSYELIVKQQDNNNE